MDFPIADLLDEDACYRRLVGLLHPDGLACPRCGRADRLGVHRRHRAPVLDYRCTACGRVFNAFTGTALHGTQRRPAEIVLILRGIAQGVPTARLARELGCDRMQLLALRHRLQGQAARWLDRNPLPDAAVEADEMYQNAGEKRRPAPRPRRPAAAAGQQAAGPRHLRQRPAAGGRGGRPRVGRGPPGGGRATPTGRAGARWSRDDAWRGRRSTPTSGAGTPGRRPARPGPRDGRPPGPRSKWARDDDGDGVREVHDNTLEGMWTGLRNFLRPFRGVSKWYLAQYVAMFQWALQHQGGRPPKVPGGLSLAYKPHTDCRT